MSKTLFRNVILMLWTLLAVVACGGGGGDGGGVASGGTGGTGVSSGTVTGFGSVFVNGVEFDTQTSSVTLDGSSGPDEATDPHRGLKVGMIVKVDGEFDDDGIHGAATEIEYEDNLEGPVDSITSIDATTKRAVVLGQTVILDKNRTNFEKTTFDTLAVGNVIEVSGLTDADRNIRATYVEMKAVSFVSGTTEMEVKGTIKNLDTGAKTFQINALTVNYASADTSDLSGGIPANDQLVEVKGTSFGAGGELIATKVEPEDDGLGVADADEAEIEGYVTAFTSSSQFTVGNQPVETTGSTVFEGGMAGDIAMGRKLEVKGSLVGGILTATKIEFED